MCRVEDVRTRCAALVGGATHSLISDVGGNDGRDDGSLRRSNGIDVCDGQPKAAPARAAVYPHRNVSAGLSGSLDAVQRVSGDGSMAAACHRVAFSDDGQHEPGAGRLAVDRGGSVSVESTKTRLPQPL